MLWPRRSAVYKGDACAWQFARAGSVVSLARLQSATSWPEAVVLRVALSVEVLRYGSRNACAYRERVCMVMGCPQIPPSCCGVNERLRRRSLRDQPTGASGCAAVY